MKGASRPRHAAAYGVRCGRWRRHHGAGNCLVFRRGGAATSDEALATGLQPGARLGKFAVPMQNCFGFTGNRMLAKRTREAYFLLEEGATPWQVDRALQELGFPMGPFVIADLAGPDGEVLA